MPKTLSPAVQTEILKEENTPIELYQIFLDEVTLYLAQWNKDIDFYDENGNPQTYTAAGVARTPTRRDTENQIDKVSVSLDNVTREMSAYVANTEIRGKTIKIIKVFQAEKTDAVVWFGMIEQDLTIPGNSMLDPENYYIVFEGKMDSPTLDQNQLTVEVNSKLNQLNKKLPGRTFGPQCNWRKFGDPDTCGVVVPTKDGFLDNVSADQKIIYDSDITEAVDYWKYGNITIGTETRIITGSGAGYVEVEYPFLKVINAGDGYSMKAGCDRTYNGGHGCTYWGNTDFYGGFRKIPNANSLKKF